MCDRQDKTIDGDRLSDIVPDAFLALRWNKSLRTLQRMRARRAGPPWLTIGRTVFYRFTDILEFEKTTRQGEGL